MLYNKMFGIDTEVSIIYIFILVTIGIFDIGNKTT